MIQNIGHRLQMSCNARADIPVPAFPLAGRPRPFFRLSAAIEFREWSPQPDQRAACWKGGKARA